MHIYIIHTNYKKYTIKTLIYYRRFLRTGKFLDVSILRNTIKSALGDITFLEAYQKTGRILNITVSGSESNTNARLLNFLTSPNVVVWSAVVASCAIPFVFEPQELYIKEKILKDDGSYKYCIQPAYLHGVTFSDGSINHDLPMNQLQQLFNVDNFIVSQVNPHLVPFLFHQIKSPIPMFDRLFKYLCDEFSLFISHIMFNLRDINILQPLMVFNGLLSQKYTGDVTIVPDILINDYLVLLSNPTNEFVQRCVKSSRKSCWKYLSRIKGLCCIEVHIDECLKQLRTQIIINRVNSTNNMLKIINSNSTKYNNHKKGLTHCDSFKAPGIDVDYMNFDNNSSDNLSRLHIPQTYFDENKETNNDNNNINNDNIQLMSRQSHSDGEIKLHNNNPELQPLTEENIDDTSIITHAKSEELIRRDPCQLSVADLVNDYAVN